MACAIIRHFAFFSIPASQTFTAAVNVGFADVDASVGARDRNRRARTICIAVGDTGAVNTRFTDLAVTCVGYENLAAARRE